MKILASVYACSPYDGSERAVGWNWIKELDKSHTITALTSYAYKQDIEDYLQKNPMHLSNTRFIYIDVPHTSWHVGYRGERLYYMLWQKAAYNTAKELIKKEKFDLVHHITYVTCILPTFMHKLGLPFLYGPVSGGENIPHVIKYPISKKDRLIEVIRKASQLFFRMTPNFSKTMKNSSLILVTTEETKHIIPKRFQNKVRIVQSIGLESDILYPKPAVRENSKCKILIAGRMIYWKGYELAIWSFIKALESGCKAELTVLGDTDDGNSAHKDYLESLCGQYLGKEIHFVSRVEHEKMKEFYDGFDILLNCSLRDSGCFVVMEGMSRGLPVICVDTGGPKVNTTETTAMKITPAPLLQMVDEMADAIKKLVTNEPLRKKLGQNARSLSESQFLMEARVRVVNEYYKEIVHM